MDRLTSLLGLGVMLLLAWLMSENRWRMNLRLILSGLLLQYVGYWTLFPYAAVMVALSFVTISLTRHGDSKPQPPGSKLEAFDAGDD